MTDLQEQIDEIDDVNIDNLEAINDNVNHFLAKMEEVS
jgi:hypothetical protein